MHSRRGAWWVVVLLAGCQGRLDTEYRALCAAVIGSEDCRSTDAGVVDGGAPDASIVDAGTPCVDTMDNPLHCGVCGRRCEGLCVQGQCLPTPVAPGGPVNLTEPHALLVGDAGFFVGESVFRCGGSSVCTSNRLFEVVEGTFVVRAQNQGPISEVVLFDNNLYWNTWEQNGLFVMARDGGAPRLLHSEDAGSTFGMVARDSRLFVVRNTPPSQLLVFDLVNEGLPVRHDLLDAGGATMLAICGDDAFVAMNQRGTAGGVIQVTRPAGPNTEVRWILSGLNEAWGIACDEANVFVTEQAGGRLIRIPRDGGGEVVLADGLGTPRGIALDGPFVYVIEHNGNPMRVMRYPIEATPDAGMAVSSRVVGGIFLRRFGDSLYWANYGANSVVRTPLLPR